MAWERPVSFANLGKMVAEIRGHWKKHGKTMKLVRGGWQKWPGRDGDSFAAIDCGLQKIFNRKADLHTYNALMAICQNYILKEKPVGVGSRTHNYGDAGEYLDNIGDKLGKMVRIARSLEEEVNEVAIRDWLPIPFFVDAGEVWGKLQDMELAFKDCVGLVKFARDVRVSVGYLAELGGDNFAKSIIVSIGDDLAAYGCDLNRNYESIWKSFRDQRSRGNRARK